MKYITCNIQKQETNKPFARKKSFSLIEVLVFVSILSIFFVTAIAAVTASLRNMVINEHKILATHYAEELMDWIKAKKEIDWEAFKNSKSSSQGKVYCFNSPIDTANFSSLDSGWPPSALCGSGFSSLNPAIYKREATLKQNGTGVNVNVNVSWQELGNTYSVPLNSVFSVWE